MGVTGERGFVEGVVSVRCGGGGGGGGLSGGSHMHMRLARKMCERDQQEGIWLTSVHDNGQAARYQSLVLPNTSRGVSKAGSSDRPTRHEPTPPCQWPYVPFHPPHPSAFHPSAQKNGEILCSPSRRHPILCISYAVLRAPSSLHPKRVPLCPSHLGREVPCGKSGFRSVYAIFPCVARS